MSFRSRIREFKSIPARDLRPHPRNWRTHSEQQESTLRALLTEVGFAGAVLARPIEGGQLELIDGHLRVKAAEPDELIPTLILDVSEEEALKILATFDPVSAMAGANLEVLDALLAEVDSQSDAVNQLLAELLQEANRQRPDRDVFDDVVPDVPENPITQPGNVWLLGQHRLCCGDSTNPEHVAKLLAGGKPRIMVTDPPYGVEYDPTWRHRAGVNNSKRVGKVENDERADWTETWNLFPGSVAYVWHGGLHSATVQESLIKAGFTTRAQIVWVKPQMVMSRGHYHWKHEPAFYAVREREKANWLADRKQTTVWDIGFSGEVTTIHGTQKPVECMARPIRHHCNHGDAVYEPFAGSGTTLIAAEQLGHPCYAMELSPQYCDVIVQRWKNLTGFEPKLE